MLSALFKPNNVAVIGASKTQTKVGYAVLSNLINGGFAGEIFPINPTADEILGHKCYPD
ncbi:MAG TPA: CoA-binding protein, partial [bacterium]|nr:CoA-binding protein [bacterium]